MEAKLVKAGWMITSLLIALLEELNERLCLLHIELIYHEVDSVQWFALALCEVQVYQRI